MPARLRPTTLACALALSLALCPAAVADSGTVEMDGSGVVFTDGDGQDNEVSFAVNTVDDQVVVRDEKQTLRSSTCDQGVEHEVICYGPSTSRLRGAGGGGDDIFTASSDGPVSIVLEGGAGDDRFLGEPLGSQYIEGGDGSDRFMTSSESTFMDGGNGDDIFVNRPGRDVVFGGEGTDVISYEHRYGVTVTLGSLADDGETGEGDYIGGDIEDITGSVGGDLLVGDDGDNRIVGGDGTDKLHGGEGDDLLAGGTGANELHGEEGDDRFVNEAFGRGSEVFDGGPGMDQVDYTAGAVSFPGGSLVRAGVVVTIGNGADDGGQGENDDVQASVENLIGSVKADRLYGSAAPNVIQGRNGDDFVDGGRGGDTLDGGLGADRIAGGSGIDTATYAGRRVPVTVTLGTGSNDGESGEGDYVASDVENATGGNQGDVLFGNGSRNALDGGPGDDLLDGGGNADELVGGVGRDTAVYKSRTAGVVVDADGAAGDDGTDADGNGSAEEGDSVADSVESIQGGSGNDFLTGNAASGRLDGNDGNDLLDGGEGADVLWGGDGNDAVSYAGRATRVRAEPGGAVDGTDAGDDGVSEEGDDISFTVEKLDGGSGDDILGGTQLANRLFGGPGDDRLAGLSGDDVLVGGAGADTLEGGFGIDTLLAIDGFADKLDCGGQADTAHRDAGVDDVNANCETQQ